MLVIDYSGVAIAAITAFREDLKKDEKDVEFLCRSVILSSIKGLKKQFKGYSDEIVIACDGNAYWRKDIFEHYKAGRKKTKEESDIPWALIYKYMDQTREDLIKHFPYKVICHPKAEADDVMAIMVEDIANKTLVQNGLEEEPTRVMLCTNDKDMKQLQKYRNVKQYGPILKKQMNLDIPPKEFLRRLILTGDSGDGIPNCFSPSDSFVNGIRQSAATEKKMAPMLLASNMLDAAPNDTVRQRIIENTSLVSFSAIPKYIRNDVVNMYEEPPKGSKMTVYKYLADRKMKLLMEDIDQF